MAYFIKLESDPSGGCYCKPHSFPHSTSTPHSCHAILHTPLPSSIPHSTHHSPTIATISSNPSQCQHNRPNETIPHISEALRKSTGHTDTRSQQLVAITHTLLLCLAHYGTSSRLRAFVPIVKHGVVKRGMGNCWVIRMGEGHGSGSGVLD